MRQGRISAPRARRLAGCAILLIAAALSSPALAETSADESQACGPLFSPTGPNAEAYGAARNYPLGAPGNFRRRDHLVGSFSRFSQIFPVHRIAGPAAASSLQRDCVSTKWTYMFEGRRHSIDDYLSRHPVTGFLIAQASTILLERYQYGRSDTDRFASQSMAKTILSMLIGIAINEGKIRSVNDLAQDYVPALKGSAYGETPLRALLMMSSGVAFSEAYDGNDDNSRMGRELRRGGDAAQFLSTFNTREVPAGTRFKYASSESEVLGLVLRAAVGEPIADYASEKLWKPMGAEADASWGVDRQGQEMTYCCFSARLRDYARLGLLLANDGEDIIPKSWVREATSAPPASSPESWRAPRRATPFNGYGYQTWLMPARRRMFALRGIHGQVILVDPASKLVLVHTAVREKPSQNPEDRELHALWFSLVQQIGAGPARDDR